MAGMKAKEQVKAILESNTLTDAYLKTHPNSTYKSAVKNGYRMLRNKDVVKSLEEIFDLQEPMAVTRDNMVKVFQTVVARWQRGMEKTQDMLRAAENLSKLVPEFVNRQEIDSYHTMQEPELRQELDRKLKGYYDAQTQRPRIPPSDVVPDSG